MKINEIYSSYDWDLINQQMQSFLPGNEYSFLSLTQEIMEGEFQGILDFMFTLGKERIKGEWMMIRQLMVSIVFLAFLSSFLTVIKGAFKNKQIAQIAHYSNYLMMIILFMDLYENIIGLCEDTLIRIEEFMRIFFPTYFILVGTSLGIKTGMLYFQLAGLVIYFIEKILILMIIPGLNIYMFLIFMNGIWEEERLEGIISLLQKIILLSFKVMMAVITGIGFLQALILPVLDGFKKEGIYHLIDTVPGVGDAAKGAFQLWLSSAAIIKNSVGVAGCILLLLFVLTPLIRIGVVWICLRVASAVLSMIGEKKIIGGINQMAKGVSLCFQTTGYGILFFLMIIAVSSYSGGG